MSNLPNLGICGFHLSAVDLFAIQCKGGFACSSNILLCRERNSLFISLIVIMSISCYGFVVENNIKARTFF